METADLRVFKEIRVALIVGVLLAIVNGIRVYLMYDQDLTLAIAIGVTMIAIVCMAKCVGCTLPLLAKKIGLDPALMGGAADLHDHGYLYDPDVFRDHNCIVSNVKAAFAAFSLFI